MYELKRSDLDRICSTYPEIRDGVKKVDEQRREANKAQSAEPS